MTATIDGIKVSGTPSEIASFIKLYKNKQLATPGLSSVTGVYQPNLARPLGGVVLC